MLSCRKFLLKINFGVCLGFEKALSGVVYRARALCTDENKVAFTKACTGLKENLGGEPFCWNRRV